MDVARDSMIFPIPFAKPDIAFPIPSPTPAMDFPALAITPLAFVIAVPIFTAPVKTFLTRLVTNSFTISPITPKIDCLIPPQIFLILSPRVA